MSKPIWYRKLVLDAAVGSLCWHWQIFGGNGVHAPPIMDYGVPTPAHACQRWWSHTILGTLWFCDTTKYLVELVIIHHQSSIMVFQHQQILDGDGAHTPSIIHYGFPSPANIWWRWCSHTTNHGLWCSNTSTCVAEMVMIHHLGHFMVLSHQQIFDGDGGHTPPIIHYGFPSPLNAL